VDDHVRLAGFCGRRAPTQGHVSSWSSYPCGTPKGLTEAPMESATAINVACSQKRCTRQPSSYNSLVVDASRSTFPDFRPPELPIPLGWLHQSAESAGLGGGAALGNRTLDLLITSVGKGASEPQKDAKIPCIYWDCRTVSGPCQDWRRLQKWLQPSMVNP
jgi:hypothetical protein